jgi:hypothetical protein
MTPVRHSDQVASRPEAKGPVFRRTGDTLTASISCEGVLHRVVITPDGATTYLDHNERVLNGLRALGNTEVIPCQEIRAAAEAARHWLDRRLRLEAPLGRFNDSSKRWAPVLAWFCCEKHRPGWQARTSVASTRVRQGVEVEPGAMLSHARSMGHLAAEHNASETATLKIGTWLAERRGVPTNARTLPDTSRAEIRDLVPAEVTDVQIDNLWALGVTLPFLRVLHEVYPTVQEAVGEEDVPGLWYRRWYSHVLEWWYAGVDTDWLREVGLHARAHWMHTRDGYGYDSWTGRILAWHEAPLSSATIGAYLAVGVRAGLPTLADKHIDPQVAADFEEITHTVADRRPTTLSEWLEQRYTVKTAFSVVRLDPHASPAWEDLRRKAIQAADQVIDEAQAADAESAQDLLSVDSVQRLLAIAALVGTPSRSVRWWQTGLALDVIAAALQAKQSPAQAVRRAARPGTAR